MIPNIIYNDIFWEGTILLEDWNEFYGENLNIALNIGGDCIVDEVTEIHEHGYNYVLLNQKEILDNILTVILKNYETWQDEYGYDEEEKKVCMPNISKVTDLKSLVYPEKIFIIDIEIEKTPYIGIQFKSKWDEEHGIGIMFYKDRIVKVGGADTAFMTWIAEEDKESK